MTDETLAQRDIRLAIEAKARREANDGYIARQRALRLSIYSARADAGLELHMIPSDVELTDDDVAKEIARD